MAKKKEQKFYKYKCTLTDKQYTTTREATHPDELVSVKGYYQLNPDKDDRPNDIKKIIEIKEQDQEAIDKMKEELGGADNSESNGDRDE